MKKLELFKEASLSIGHLSKIYAGVGDIKTEHNVNGTKICDVHHDDNDNKQVDAGECIDIVEC